MRGPDENSMAAGIFSGGSMALRHLADRDRASDWAADPARSRLCWYLDEESGKAFFVLSQAGRFADLCYDHGRLLGPEIGRGVFPEILDTIDVDTDAESDALDIVYRALFARIIDDLFPATSGEFQDGVGALARGAREGGLAAGYGFEEVKRACVAIDAGNISTGFTRRLEKWGAADFDLAGALGYLVEAVSRYPGIDPNPAGRDRAASLAALSAQAARRRLGMGCTGFALAPGEADGGRGLHARTFDGAFFAWNAVPGLFVIDERGTDPRAKHRYAAVGTAGLVYPGGISGLNDAGLACSLHQMSTTTYATGAPGGEWEIAPFLQQRILREAGDLDAAIRICRETRHFGSWAILVSDARAGRSVRIEINGRAEEDGGPRIRDSARAPAQVQTNHFREPGMVERFDHFADAHFTKSPGKWLETRARLARVEGRLETLLGIGPFATTDAIDLLADHGDAFLPGQAVRPFGRTVCKAYGLMSSIARTDPDRTRAADEMWFTIGDPDGRPGPHSACVGFAIDWEGREARPVTDAPVRRARTIPEDLRDALAAYVQGFRAYARPRDAAGGYLGREPRPAERAAILREALGHLDAAVRRAEDATGEPALVFRYVRARLLHRLGAIEPARFGDAKRDWDILLGLADRTGAAPPGGWPVPMHGYERALILVYAAASESALGNRDAADRLARQGEALLGEVSEALFPDGDPHPGLSEFSSLAWETYHNAAAPEGPEIDFVTIE